MDQEIIEEEEAIATERAAEAARLGVDILNQSIREVATMKPAVCVAPETPLRVAIDHMKEKGVGCVLVQRDTKLVGIFTERDVLVRVVGAGVDIDRTPVEALMTPDPESLSPDDRVSYALNKMTIGGFRHIPVVDDDDRPVGIVSMRNVVNYVVDVFRVEVLNLPPSPRLAARAREGA